jgi:quercetin dioxygenase-like cupin family protein
MKVSRQGIALGAVACSLIGVAVASGPVQATPSTSTSTVLVQAPISPLRVVATNKTATGKRWAALLASYGMTDGYVVENDFQPGQTTGWHSHPGPSIVFVVSGSITNYTSDQPHCRGVSYSAGSTFVDAGGTDVHELVDNGTTAAETIAVQFIPQGQARRIDEPEPSNCHI